MEPPLNVSDKNAPTKIKIKRQSENIKLSLALRET